MTSTHKGRYTREAMTEAMRDVTRRLGVTADDARLLRLTNNAVFALPAAGLVIRITRSRVFHDRVRKVVRLADWFEAVDAPTTRLAPVIRQPIGVRGLLATVWQYVLPTPPAPTVDDLGVVLRRFHCLGTPPFPVPPWDPVGDARTRLDDAEALDDGDCAFLHQWCERLEPHIAALNADIEPSLVHADATVGNVLRTPDGQIVLCDFDATCLGPWQADLAAVAVGEVRFGRAGMHSRLATAYGYDVTADAAWPLLREARELKLVAAAVPLLASAPGIAEEFARRIRSMRDGDSEARWTPFADIRR